MSDSLFHGFRGLFGVDCVDYPIMEHMYKENFSQVKTDKCKGFSLYNRLDNIEVDRDDIDNKIKSGFFDLVVYSIHHSCNNDKNRIFETIGKDTPSKKCVVDGNDVPQMFIEIPTICPLFKREMRYVKNNVYPISFSIPKENIVDDIPEKIHDFAHIIPGMHGHPHLQTYTYGDEKSYFDDYKNSYFAFTSMKGGWDCLRHYEIIACGCMPYFTDIEHKPSYTMSRWPKHHCKWAKELVGVEPSWRADKKIGTTMDVLNTHKHYIDHSRFPKSQYFELLHKIIDWTKQYLTTEAQAKQLMMSIKGLK